MEIVTPTAGLPFSSITFPWTFPVCAKLGTATNIATTRKPRILFVNFIEPSEFRKKKFPTAAAVMDRRCSFDYIQAAYSGFVEYAIGSSTPACWNARNLKAQLSQAP